MPKLVELREKQQEVVSQARQALDLVSKETTEVRAKELETQYDGFMAEYDKLDAQIQREEKLAAVESRMNAPDPRRPVYTNSGTPAIGESTKASYRDAFSKAIQFGVNTLNNEEREVFAQGRSEIPAEIRAQTVTTTGGGHTVPTEFSGEIDKAMSAWGPMWDASVVRELNTSNGRNIPWPTVDDTAKTGRIKSINTTVDDDNTDDVVFGQKQLDAYIYDTGMVRIPLELLQDSAFNIEALMNDLFGERLGRLANAVLTTGNGSGAPNGIVSGSAVGKAAAAVAAFTADELIDLVHSVDPAYRQSPKCRWQFNDTVLAAIRKLKDGQNNYLWQLGDVRTGEPNLLLGFPYSVNQAMANPAANAKPIIFGDHSRYIVRKVMGFQVMTLRERYAENFQVGMVGFKRFDGELMNTAAVKHLIMDDGV